LDTPANLVRNLNLDLRITFQVNGQKPAVKEVTTGTKFNLSMIQGLSGIKRVEQQGELVTIHGEESIKVGSLVSTLEAEGVHFTNLRTEHADLEDVFLSLTGREMK
jgi:hypothetical protein